MQEVTQNIWTNDLDIKNAELSGPAFYNICIASDQIDIISLETLWKLNEKNERIDACEFDKKLLFSFEDNKHTRCLNIKSLYGMIKKGIYNNPFTNEPLKQEILNRINQKIKLLEDHGISLTNNQIVTKDQNLTLKITDVFSKYDNFGLFLDVKWFTSFSIKNLKSIFNEGNKMWTAFKEDNIIVAKNINPQLDGFDSNIDEIKDIYQMQMILLDQFDKFISSGINDVSKKMGGYVVIGALCYVSKEIKSIYNMFILDD